MAKSASRKPKPSTSMKPPKGGAMKGGKKGC